MRYSVAARNLMLETLDESVATGAKYGSLHTAYSTAGANELAGGSPAYARVALTWAAATGASKATSAQAQFNVPPSSTVRWIGLWDSLTGGNFLGMTPNGGLTPQQFVVSNPANDTLECVGHGFVNNDTAVVWQES